jgi:peptide/nickel transport system permease protein
VTDTSSAGTAAVAPGLLPTTAGSGGRPGRANRAGRANRTGKKKLGVFFWICSGWIGLIILVAIFANVLPLPKPDFENFAAPQNGAPAWGHLLGTDDLNRDIFSRLLFGSRVSLVVGFGSTAIGMILGGIPAMFSAYRRGRVDTFLNTTSYAVLAFPALVAVIAIGSFWGHQLWKITLVIGIFSAPVIFRVIRAATLSYASRPATGASWGARYCPISCRPSFPSG